MKIAFISNFLSHHQIPFCQAMERLLGDSFKFIATEEMDTERKEMGWTNNGREKYEIKAFRSKEEFVTARIFIDSCDIAIIGSAPYDYIMNRLKSNKITIKYSERFYKEGLSYKKIPRAIIGSYLHYGRFKKKPFYLLCASAYTAADINTFWNFKNKTYKWGYFPEIKKYDLEDLMLKKNQIIPEILWCGRMLPLKHPSTPAEIAFKLKKAGYRFHMTIIGEGEMRDNVEKLINEFNLNSEIKLMDFMPQEKVREYMEQANIYLFTSDFNEGWGAVLNESMNSGCAVVASHAIGSVPFLIEDGVDGIIYKNGDINDLYFKVSDLIENPEKCYKLGKRAYKKIESEWNAEFAAKRLVKLCEELQENGECHLFENGPCSKAEVLANDWYLK